MVAAQDDWEGGFLRDINKSAKTKERLKRLQSCCGAVLANMSIPLMTSLRKKQLKKFLFAFLCPRGNNNNNQSCFLTTVF